MKTLIWFYVVSCGLNSAARGVFRFVKVTARYRDWRNQWTNRVHGQLWANITWPHDVFVGAHSAHILSKPRLLGLVAITLVANSVQAQGVFLASNIAARTRLASANGPLAGTNIYAQYFAGPAVDSLDAIGATGYHINGHFFVGTTAVPGLPPYQEGYVQMVAWASTYWGETLAGVPENQLGRTDVVTVFLVNAELRDPRSAPRFTQPAVVPPIPEPSVWSLALLSGLLALWRFRRRRTVSR